MAVVAAAAVVVDTVIGRYVTAVIYVLPLLFFMLAVVVAVIAVVAVVAYQRSVTPCISCRAFAASMAWNKSTEDLFSDHHYYCRTQFVRNIISSTPVACKCS